MVKMAAHKKKQNLLLSPKTHSSSPPPLAHPECSRITSLVAEPSSKSWTKWAQKHSDTFDDATVSTSSRTPLEEEIMRIRRDDVGLYGLCPKQEQFDLVVCDQCNLAFKQQALIRHYERRHSRLLPSLIHRTNFQSKSSHLERTVAEQSRAEHSTVSTSSQPRLHITLPATLAISAAHTEKLIMVKSKKLMLDSCISHANDKTVIRSECDSKQRTNSNAPLVSIIRKHNTADMTAGDNVSRTKHFSSSSHEKSLPRPTDDDVLKAKHYSSSNKEESSSRVGSSERDVLKSEVSRRPSSRSITSDLQVSSDRLKSAPTIDASKTSSSSDRSKSASSTLRNKNVERALTSSVSSSAIAKSVHSSSVTSRAEHNRNSGSSGFSKKENSRQLQSYNSSRSSSPSSMSSKESSTVNDAIEQKTLHIVKHGAEPKQADKLLTTISKASAEKTRLHLSPVTDMPKLKVKVSKTDALQDTPLLLKMDRRSSTTSERSELPFKVSKLETASVSVGGKPLTNSVNRKRIFSTTDDDDSLSSSSSSEDENERLKKPVLKSKTVIPNKKLPSKPTRRKSTKKDSDSESSLSSSSLEDSKRSASHSKLKNSRPNSSTHIRMSSEEIVPPRLQSTKTSLKADDRYHSSSDVASKSLVKSTASSQSAVAPKNLKDFVVQRDKTADDAKKSSKMSTKPSRLDSPAVVTHTSRPLSRVASKDDQKSLKLSQSPSSVASADSQRKRHYGEDSDDDSSDGAGHRKKLKIKSDNKTAESSHKSSILPFDDVDSDQKHSRKTDSKTRTVVAAETVTRSVTTAKAESQSVNVGRRIDRAPSKNDYFFPPAPLIRAEQQSNVATSPLESRNDSKRRVSASISPVNGISGSDEMAPSPIAAHDKQPRDIVMSKSSSARAVLCKDREFDADIHCGHIVQDTGKQCTHSLTCKYHCLTLRRAVLGRSKPFDELLSEHKQRQEEKQFLKLDASTRPSSTNKRNSIAPPIRKSERCTSSSFDGELDYTPQRSPTTVIKLTGSTQIVSSSCSPLPPSIQAIASSASSPDIQKEEQQRWVWRDLAMPRTTCQFRSTLSGSVFATSIIAPLSNAKPPLFTRPDQLPIRPPEEMVPLSDCVQENEQGDVASRALSSDEEEEVNEDDDNASFYYGPASGSSTYLCHHPRPCAVNTFGAWKQAGVSGMYLFNRGEERTRLALALAVEQILRPPTLAPLPASITHNKCRSAVTSFSVVSNSNSSCSSTMSMSGLSSTNPSSTARSQAAINIHSSPFSSKPTSKQTKTISTPASDIHIFQNDDRPISLLPSFGTRHNTLHSTSTSSGWSASRSTVTTTDNRSGTSLTTGYRSANSSSTLVFSNTGKSSVNITTAHSSSSDERLADNGTDLFAPAERLLNPSDRLFADRSANIQNSLLSAPLSLDSSMPNGKCSSSLDWLTATDQPAKRHRFDEDSMPVLTSVTSCTANKSSVPSTTISPAKIYSSAPTVNKWKQTFSEAVSSTLSPSTSPCVSVQNPTSSASSMGTNAGGKWKQTFQEPSSSAAALHGSTLSTASNSKKTEPKLSATTSTPDMSLQGGTVANSTVSYNSSVAGIVSSTGTLQNGLLRGSPAVASNKHHIANIIGPPTIKYDSTNPSAYAAAPQLTPSVSGPYKTSLTDQQPYTGLSSTTSSLWSTPPKPLSTQSSNEPPHLQRTSMHNPPNLRINISEQNHVAMHPPLSASHSRQFSSDSQTNQSALRTSGNSGGNPASSRLGSTAPKQHDAVAMLKNRSSSSRLQSESPFLSSDQLDDFSGSQHQYSGSSYQSGLSHQPADLIFRSRTISSSSSSLSSTYTSKLGPPQASSLWNSPVTSHASTLSPLSSKTAQNQRNNSSTGSRTNSVERSSNPSPSSSLDNKLSNLSMPSLVNHGAYDHLQMTTPGNAFSNTRQPSSETIGRNYDKSPAVQAASPALASDRLYRQQEMMLSNDKEHRHKRKSTA